MEKLMTRTEFIKIMDLLNYEGNFTASYLLNIKINDYFKNDFVDAIVFDANNKMLVLRKRKDTELTYEVFSIK